MKTAPHKMFGETRNVRLSTITNGKVDKPPREQWHETLWIERGEDWYALMSNKFKGKTVRVVERSDWLSAKKV